MDQAAEGSGNPLCVPLSLLALPSSHTHSVSLICILLSFSFHATQNINPIKAGIFVLFTAVLPEPKTGPGIYVNTLCKE